MTAIYHITHVDNLAAILQRGALLSDSAIAAQALTPRSIAYGHIKERRSRTQVTVPPGGVVSDYVPFYFCPRSPMLCAIWRGQVEGVTMGQAGIVHLVADAVSLRQRGLACVHTDGNAASQPLTFHAGTDQLQTALSWDVIRSNSWGNTPDDNDRKRRKQAEFLVHNEVPWDAITQIGVIDATMADRVRAILAASGAPHAPAVTVQRDWYYR